MCGIDPGELTPFQGGTVYWTVPGVETPGLNPIAPSGHKNKPKERLTSRHSRVTPRLTLVLNCISKRKNASFLAD